MNIAGLRVRITIQKNETVVDKYGNHKSAWNNYFNCWATALTSGLSASEKESAGHTTEADKLDITVRYSSETAAVNSKEYRVLLEGRIYNILSMERDQDDHFHCDYGHPNQHHHSLERNQNDRHDCGICNPDGALYCMDGNPDNRHHGLERH